MKLIPKEAAEKIYDYLIKYGGAPVSIHDGIDRNKEAFVFHASGEGITEYRCVYKLGFGGKFYNDYSQWRVAYYVEDKTPERDALVKKINKFLAELRKEYFIGWKP